MYYPKLVLWAASLPLAYVFIGVLWISKELFGICSVPEWMYRTATYFANLEDELFPEQE